MALYEFRCTDDRCDTEFEERVPIAELDTKEIKCPKCGLKAERKVSLQRSAHTTWKNWRL